MMSKTMKSCKKIDGNVTNGFSSGNIAKNSGKVEYEKNKDNFGY